MRSKSSMIRVRLNGSNEGLQALQKLADKACEGACLNAIQANRIALALDELFANIHEHGYANQGGEIECLAQRLNHDDDNTTMCLLEIKLRDFAPVLKNLDHCQGVCPETLKDNPIAGGLGMHLIYATTEIFEHSPLADGNQWRLVFNIEEKIERGGEKSL